MSLQEGPSTAQRSYALETIPETQYSDLEVVLPHVGAGCGHLPFTLVNPNSTTLPIQSTPGIDSPVIGLQSICSEFISPVFRMHVPSTGRHRDNHTSY